MIPKGRKFFFRYCFAVNVKSRVGFLFHKENIYPFICSKINQRLSRLIFSVSTYRRIKKDLLKNDKLKWSVKTFLV